MSNTKHTPTPWRIGRSIPTAVLAKNSDGDDKLVVAMLGSPSETRNFDQRKADAAFIVRAVNSHEQLVAALNKIESGADFDAALVARKALDAAGLRPGA